MYDVVPVIPNNKEAPNKKNPEANAPSIKYLRPASDDFKNLFWLKLGHIMLMIVTLNLDKV